MLQPSAEFRICILNNLIVEALSCVKHVLLDLVDLCSVRTARHNVDDIQHHYIDCHELFGLHLCVVFNTGLVRCLMQLGPTKTSCERIHLNTQSV